MVASGQVVAVAKSLVRRANASVYRARDSCGGTARWTITTPRHLSVGAADPVRAPPTLIISVDPRTRQMTAEETREYGHFQIQQGSRFTADRRTWRIVVRQHETCSVLVHSRCPRAWSGRKIRRLPMPHNGRKNYEVSRARASIEGSILRWLAPRLLRCKNELLD